MSADTPGGSPGRPGAAGGIKIGAMKRVARSVRVASLLLVSVLAPLVAGAEATRGGRLPVPLPLFPPNNWWNLDISAAPLDPGSAGFINFIGPARQLHPDFGGNDPTPPEIYGIPYIVVDGNQPKKTVQFQYADESDGVDHNTGQSFPFYPIPDEAITQPYWIEGGYPGQQCVGGDRHMLLADRGNKLLYELFDLCWDGAQWTAGSGAFFDMKTNNRRPDGWTSADAAGLAILPGLVRHDEVFGPDEIDHAFRFTVRATNGYVYPASHQAGTTASASPRSESRPTLGHQPKKGKNRASRRRSEEGDCGITRGETAANLHYPAVGTALAMRVFGRSGANLLPIIAAAAMALSSVSVIGNALRLRATKV